MAVLLAVAHGAAASLPLQASLSDLACGADHILVGTVVGVDMIDGAGRPVHDEKARTGPGLSNRIRLIIKVQEVIESKATVPKELRVPLDPFTHFTLGQIKSAHDEPSQPNLIFLRGADFLPIIAGQFRRALAERDEAMRLREQCKAERAAR